ncbi:MAG: flagellar motor switch protein FliN [Gammaproteobacteria bacterium]|nr:MAG: flagellar motor switch protein FliN [Gammaproteobacteria bacterium]
MSEQTQSAAATDDDAAADWAAALAEQEATEKAETRAEAQPAARTDKGAQSTPAAAAAPRPMDVPELAGGVAADDGDADRNLDVILDIPVTLSMEIGRTRLPIRNLLQLNQGSVVELERLAGEPMDVLVNGTLIAHGEVVVINERYGIRLTDVVSPAERVRKLR